MSTPKPKLPATKTSLVQQQHKTSAKQNPPQQQKQQQQAPAAPSGQLPLRSATPTGGAAKAPPAGPATTNSSPGRPNTPVKEPHTTWTPVSELKQLIPRGLKSAPAVPPPAAGQPFQWKYFKAPSVKYNAPIKRFRGVFFGSF